MMGASIAMASFVVGLVAAALTLLGMPLGKRASALWGKRIEMIGGLILIAVGFMSLWSHKT
jgi:putative Mn2+ efflux pump MntP